MKLSVKHRDLTGKKVKSLRREGLLPAVIYGRHVTPQSISCVKNDLLKVYKTSGYTTPVELVGDVDQLVLINFFQLDPVTDELISADFLAVSRTEKVVASVPVEMIGECPLEKLNEGRVNLVKDTVEVEAFPQDLPNRIEIDISTLTTINDVVFVRDLKVSSKVEIVDDMELPVLTIAVLFDEVEETTDSMEPTVERTLESTEPTP